VLRNLRAAIRCHFRYVNRNNRIPYNIRSWDRVALTQRDLAFILRKTNNYKEQQFLFSLFQYAKANSNQATLVLPKRVVIKFKGSSTRTYRERISFAEHIGLLVLITDFNRHRGIAREYHITYKFRDEQGDILSLDEGINRIYKRHVIKRIYSRRISTKLLRFQLI